MRDSGLYKNANTRSYLQTAVHAIRQNFSQARVCLLLGDLADGGSNTSYDFIREQMQGLNMPAFATTGNHDNRANMRSYFPSSYDSDGFAQSMHKLAPEWRLFVLDSKREGNMSGELCQKRLTWLKRQLDRCSEANLIIALHHPPTPMAVPTMDHYALGYSEGLYSILYPERERVRMIICAHFHLTISASWHGIPIAMVPALSHNHWTGTRRQPSFSLIALSPNGQVAVHGIHLS